MAERIALCLTGGGASGALFQIGVLAALEDGIVDFSATELDLYVGTNSGASVAAALAGGCSVRRLYRALLDPADKYFGLERRHLLRFDLAEWKRTLITALRALTHGTSSLFSRTDTTTNALWEELERLYDSMPAGLFTLESYERFLEDFFLRRNVPNSFLTLQRPLRIMAYDLDSAEQVVFGDPEHDMVTVTRACAASMAVPPFFSPVRIGDRHYIDPGSAQATHLDVAQSAGVDTVLLINPMVPVKAETVPTGHGRRHSLRDKGLMWVVNQANRIGALAQVQSSCERAERRDSEGALRLVRIEPDAARTQLFLQNPTRFDTRRTILEQAYRETRTRLLDWFAAENSALSRAGFSPKPPVSELPGQRAG